MKILWLVPPSKRVGEYPLVGQNRWFKYLSVRTNFIYPEIAASGCTMLKDAGFDVTFIDAPVQERTAKDILDDVKSVYYDLIITEGRTAVINWVWELVHKIHEVDKHVNVAMYGDHVVCRPQESLDKGADFVINSGDYDNGALRLAKSIDNMGITPRNFIVPNLQDLNTLPQIDKTIVDWHNYYETWRHREEFGWATSGRGCYAGCTYCSWNFLYYGHKLRTMTPENAVNRIEHDVNKYGIKEFLDDADTFLCGTWGASYAAEILGRKLDVFWNIQTRSDCVARTRMADMKLMSKSGLHVVKLGGDAGNDYSLWRINKGCTIADTEKAVKMLKEAGCEVHINMIIGYPWESKKEAYDTIKWVKRLKPNQAQFSLLQPYIGTPLYDEAIKEGWFDIDPNDYDSWNTKKPILKGIMSPDEISQLYRDSWHDFYFDLGFVTRQLGKSVASCFRHGNLDSFRHLWRGYKAVKNGHEKAMD
jgi:radical SAM superfamily enzyme YgiQ (UPF0313 family)